MLSDLVGILAEFRHLVTGRREFFRARFTRKGRRAVLAVRGHVLNDGVDFGGRQQFPAGAGVTALAATLATAPLLWRVLRRVQRILRRRSRRVLGVPGKPSFEFLSSLRERADGLLLLTNDSREFRAARAATALGLLLRRASHADRIGRKHVELYEKVCESVAEAATRPRAVLRPSGQVAERLRPILIAVPLTKAPYKARGECQDIERA